MKQKHLAVRPLFLVVAIAFGACSTPLDSVKKFGSATEVAAKTADDAFIYFNAETIAAQIDIRKYENEKIQAKDTVGPIEKSKDLRSCQNALRALGDYASGLELLASKDDAARIDTAAASIGTGLGNLSQTTASLMGGAPMLSADQTAVISTVVSIAGKKWIINKRRKAVREVVTLANPDLQKIVENLSQSLGASSNELQADMNEARNARIRGYNRRLEAGAYADARLRDEHAAEIQAYSLKVQQVLDVFTAARKSLAAVGEAHEKLNEAALSNKFDLAAFAAKVSQLRSDVAQLEKAFAAAK